MKKILGALFVVTLLAACSLLNTDYTSQFFGTWSGNGSGSAGDVTDSYTFNQDKTFSETAAQIDSSAPTDKKGTWDADTQNLKLDYSTGYLTQCTYAFGTFNGTADLQLTWSNLTELLLKQ